MARESPVAKRRQSSRAARREPGRPSGECAGAWRVPPATWASSAWAPPSLPLADGAAFSEAAQALRCAALRLVLPEGARKRHGGAGQTSGNKTANERKQNSKRAERNIGDDRRRRPKRPKPSLRFGVGASARLPPSSLPARGQRPRLLRPPLHCPSGAVRRAEGLTASGGHKRLAIGGGRRRLDAFDLDMVSRARQAQRIASRIASRIAQHRGGRPNGSDGCPWGSTLRARRRHAACTPTAQAEHRPSFSPAPRR